MQSARDYHRIEEVPYRFGHCGLQRKSHDWRSHACHRRDDAGISRRTVEHVSGGDLAARGLYRDDAVVLDVDPGHLGLLMDVDAAGVGATRVTPVDRIVANDPAWRMVKRAQNRVSHVLRDVQIRNQSLDLLRIDDLGPDTFELVDLSSPAHRAQRTVSVGEREMAGLREHHVEVQISRQLFVQLHRAVVEAYAFGRQVVGANDRGDGDRNTTAHATSVDQCNISDSVVSGQVVRRRESMYAGPDDDDVIGRLEIVPWPRPGPAFASQSVTKQAPRGVASGQPQWALRAIAAVAQPGAFRISPELHFARPSLLNWACCRSLKAGFAFKSRYPVRPRQLNLCHRCRLDSERGKVLAFQMMNVGFAAGACQRDQFHVHYVQIVAQPPCSFFRAEPGLEFRHLGSDAHRTHPGMAVMAVAWSGAEPLVVGANVLMRAAVCAARRIASERNQHGLSNRNGVGAHREGLGDIGASPDAARDDELNLAHHLHLFQGLDRFSQGGQGWYSGMLDEHLLSSGGPGLHAVDHDHVGTTLYGQLDVVEDARGAHFDVDRHLPVGNLPQFGD